MNRGSQAGLSLVEATIILMVLSILTAALAPAAGAYLEESRNTKAKADVEGIGAAIDQTLRDTGLPCLSFNGSSCANSTTGRVELLMSGTSTSASEPTVIASMDVNLGATGLASAQNLNWAGGTNAVAANRRDLMDNHFVTNSPAYTAVSFTAGGGPRPGSGWRGPYVNGPLDVDPWGYAYQASTVFLIPASDATDGTGTGQRRGGWTQDVVVISAGSNGTIQTAFGAAGTAAVGDDVVYVVQGATH
jgi:Tfp pilus assembly protein PilE